MEDENKQQPSLPPGDDVPNWTMVNSQGTAQAPNGPSAMTPPPFQPAPAPAQEEMVGDLLLALG